jgi:N-acetylmuramoyl-L-alanine amidase
LQLDVLQGNVRRGTVEAEDRNGMRFVALEEVMSRLAFAASPISGGFVVTYTGRKIEFWNGSNVARVNGMVSPLAAEVAFDGAHWWSESASSLEAIKLFLSSVSRPADISFVPSDTPAPQDVVVASSLPVAPPATAPDPPPVGENTSAVLISRVRWGEQADAHRAVVDISSQVETSVDESAGRVEVTFRGAGSPGVSGRSPWPSLSVESKKQGNDVVLVFTHSSDKIKGFWVADPPRYVVDFYLTGPGPEQAMPVAGGPSDSPDQIEVPPAPAPVPNSGKIETTPKRPPPAPKNKFLVVIDAGHGGHDGGAVGNKLKEKDLNLLAALQLGISMKAIGMDVHLTRQDDRYLKLAERTEIANKTDADVFISLHCNALPKGKHATGTELYLMAEQTDQDALNLAIMENRELSGDAENAAEITEAADKRTRLLLKILGDMQQSDKINESTTLAEFIYDKLRASGMQIRKVRQAPFFVLRGAGMPALLIEMGYITEASDAKKLNSQAERKKMMDAVAAAVHNYLSKRPGEGGSQ